MQAMIQWDELRVLLAIQRGRSYAIAGRALGVDGTTVSRRLRELETSIGAHLVERTPDGLVLTATGLRAIRVAEQVEELVTGLDRELLGADERIEGDVRVTAGEGLLVHAIAPAVPKLQARYPGLKLEFIGATRTLDLARREADVAVRLSRPREPGLVTRKLGVLEYGLYASADYLRRKGTPRRVAELANHDFVAFDASLDSIPEMRWLAKHVPPERLVLRASTLPVLLSACVSGVGILAMAELFGNAAPLTRVLPSQELPSREAWGVVHPDLRRVARVKVVLDWLAEVLAGREVPR
jgi:DNA-binding transcriptional LysR family regulator